MCETENPGNAVECTSCGKPLRKATEVPGFAPPIEGLEHTLQQAVEVDVEPVPGLEETRVALPGLRVTAERLAVERTPHVSNGGAVNWVAGQLEIEPGRAADSGERTPAPSESGRCPWCGSISAGAVCDTCGRARARYSVAAQRDPAKTGETVLCPACLARVFPGARCLECGVPLPARDR